MQDAIRLERIAAVLMLAGVLSAGLSVHVTAKTGKQTRAGRKPRASKEKSMSIAVASTSRWARPASAMSTGLKAG